METLGPEALKENQLFQDLEPEMLRKILEFTERRECEAGSLVFSQDEEAEKIFLVEEGLVGVVIEISPSTKLTIASESKGGIIGWSAVVPPHRYTASAKCFKRSRLLALDGKKLREFCHQEPELGLRIIEELATVIALRLQKTNLQVLDAMWR
jgi:CRP/FNR family cyclic AMP-dependent transcriptional regulator